MTGILYRDVQYHYSLGDLHVSSMECIDHVLRLDVEWQKNDGQIHRENSLEDAFRNYQKEVIMEEVNCEECRTDVTKTKVRTILAPLPPVLFVEVKRYRRISDKVIKIERSNMKCPNKFSIPGHEGTVYMLRFVHVHTGPLTSGHHYCYVKKTTATGEEEWLKFNNSFNNIL